MRTRIIQVRASIAVAVALVGLASAVPASAQECNTRDGNVELSVNYNAVGYGEISVCNISENIDPQAVQHAIDAWNGTVGKTLFTTDCGAPTGVLVRDVSGYCGDVACADRPWQEAPLLLGVYVEPAAAGWSLDDQKCLMVHEIGHNLGFSHWPVCESVMHATLCDCNFLEPTQIDADNYENAYWVEGVTNLTGSSPSPGTVSLDWSTVNSAGQQLCNEKEFGVWRLDPGTGWYTMHVATAGQNGTASEFGGEPSGSQSYRVWSVTDALSISAAGYAPVTVNVLPPVPPPPSAVTLSGSNGTGTVSWNSVSGATSYSVYVGRWNNGGYATVVNWVQDTSSPYNFPYSLADDYYAQVKACNASGCSAPRDSSPYWVALGPRFTSVFLFGPAPVKVSNTTGRYMWIISLLRNPDAASVEVRFRDDVTGCPSGCTQSGLDEGPILPGMEQLWLTAGQEMWILYRARYECHSPAQAGTYALPAQMCVRYAWQGVDLNCRGQTRQLIVQ